MAKGTKAMTVKAGAYALSFCLADSVPENAVARFPRKIPFAGDILKPVRSFEKALYTPVSYTHLDVYKRQP